MSQNTEVQKTLETFLTLLHASDLKETGDQIVGAFEALVKTYQAIKADTEAEREQRSKDFATALMKLRSVIDDKVRESTDTIESAFKEQSTAQRTIDTRTLTDALTSLQTRIDARIATLKDGETPSDAHLKELITPLIPAPLPGSPDSAEDVRNKLEVLPDGEKLRIEAIEGLRKELDALEKKLRSSGSGTTMIAQTRGAVKIYDLSDQLNGSTKTFSLPAFGLILDVKASSSPQPMLQNTEYTVDGAAMTLTFTAQIDASTTLAQGQRIVILYAEL